MHYAEELTPLDISDLRPLYEAMQSPLRKLGTQARKMAEEWPCDNFSYPRWSRAERELIVLEEIVSDLAGEIGRLLEHCELIHDLGFEEDESDYEEDDYNWE